MSVTRRSFITAIAGSAIAVTSWPAANAQENEMGSQLLDAVRKGDAAEVARLLKAGVSVDHRDEAKRTPLLVATHADNVDIARLLIAAGADVNAKDNIRETPFLFAGAQGRNEILKLILATGKANLADTNRYGGTALIPSAEKGHPETVRMLIKAGVAIDHINNLGWTALLEAVVLSNGGPTHQEIVRDLLDAGADWRIGDKDGVNSLDHARRRGFTEIVRLIEAKGGR